VAAIEELIGIVHSFLEKKLSIRKREHTQMRHSMPHSGEHAEIAGGFDRPAIYIRKPFHNSDPNGKNVSTLLCVGCSSARAAEWIFVGALA
jgi:hypothetical protein